jgi:carboxymethylenebutenolidase
MITYPIKNEQEANAYLVKSASASKDYLIVVHEWCGLNNFLKSESERLTEELGNINVIAPHLYNWRVVETRENA